MFYNLLLRMWKENRISSEKLQSYVPLFISQEEYDSIIATNQGI